ncbi:MAG: DUF3299 domain-containing protein [Sumerlaeia bacterium]
MRQRFKLSSTFIKSTLFIPVALVMGVLFLPNDAYNLAKAQAADKPASPAVVEITPATEEAHTMRNQDEITSGTLLLQTMPRQEGEIDFDLLRTTTLNRTPPPVFDPELDQLEGKTVKLRGFMTPFDSLTNFDTFMAFPFATGCNFCAPPSPLEVVLVRMKEKGQKFVPEPIEVEGTLSLWRKDKTDNAHKSFLYIMNDAKITVLSFDE